MSSTNYEKYLRGEPLNEELAALRAGQLSVFAAAVTQAIDAPIAPKSDAEKPLTKEERQALREIRVGPGWPVVQKLFERATIAHTKAAMVASQQDPLPSGTELAEVWRQVKVWKELMAHLNWSIIVELEEETHG